MKEKQLRQDHVYLCSLSSSGHKLLCLSLPQRNGKLNVEWSQTCFGAQIVKWIISSIACFVVQTKRLHRQNSYRKIQANNYPTPRIGKQFDSKFFLLGEVRARWKKICLNGEKKYNCKYNSVEGKRGGERELCMKKGNTLIDSVHRWIKIPSRMKSKAQFLAVNDWAWLKSCERILDLHYLSHANGVRW